MMRNRLGLALVGVLLAGGWVWGQSVTAPIASLQASNLQLSGGGAALKTAIVDATGAIITSFGGGTQFAEDAASANADVGTQALCVRDDTLNIRSGTEGDYEPCHTNADGAIWVADINSTTSNGYLQEIRDDIADLLGNLAVDGTHDNAVVATGAQTMLEAKDFDGSALPNVVSAEGDSVRAAGSLYGVQYVKLVNEDGSKTPFVVEDAAETAANVLVGIGTIRRDTAASSADTTGDNATLNTDSLGRLWITGSAVEDAGETAGGLLNMLGTVRRDTAASSAGTTADNATLNTDANGLLWGRQLDPCSGVAKSYYVVNVSSATTVELANAVANEFFYICSVNLVAAAAQTIALAEDDTDGCGSLTAGLAGGATAATGWSFAANGGLTLGNGASSVMRTGTANRYLCAITGQAAQISGTITYVSAP